MPNKPAKNMRMAGAQVKALQNRLKKDSQLRGRFRQFVEDLKEVTKTGQFRKASWIDHRFAHEYNWTFSSVLQQSIEEELLDIAKATGSKKLRVWDDGAGEGDFLAWIKPEMAKYGIECETTALNHDANWRLMERYKEGEIDRVVVGLAETALPKRKQHAIFSLNGSLMYSPPELKRYILKKYAFALEKGGIACIGINDLEPEMILGKKERAYHEKRMSAEKDIHWMQKQVERKKAEIIRILEKNGFEAKFFSVPELRKRNLPREILVIRNPVRQKK